MDKYETGQKAAEGNGSKGCRATSRDVQPAFGRELRAGKGAGEGEGEEEGGLWNGRETYET